jgi:hypothetical protein
MALLCLLSASGSLAQIRVELEFEQETYLPREPLHAVVRIYNMSGRTLVLGQDSQWLSFTVENVNGSLVEQTKTVDVQGEFTLPSSSRARKLVNLAEAYDMGKFGRYLVQATVQIPGWPETYSSKQRAVGIATGVKLWEQAFGVPDDLHGQPELRKYQLLSANHLKQLSLYVRVTGDSEADTFKLFPLGSMHGFSRPEPQVDRWSNLHVLYQDGATRFRYNMITPDGLLLTRQTWEVTPDSRPALRVDTTGRIVVAGGTRRVSATDLPPPDLLSELNDEPAAGALAADQRTDANSSAK